MSSTAPIITIYQPLALDSRPLPPQHSINIHFQPELPCHGENGNLSTVIQNLAAQKRYCSQFTTGVSNGGLLASSNRAQWEHRLFGNFYISETGTEYSTDDGTSAPTRNSVNTISSAFQFSELPSTPPERPKYGAVNIISDPYGAAPRFGPCYLRLKNTAGFLARCTFVFPDNFLEPTCYGTAEKFSHVETLALKERGSMTRQDPLDWYIEAHVHGPLLLDIDGDVDAIVLDPSYRDTFVEAAARELGCALEWHLGYVVDMQRMNSEEREMFCEYRGMEVMKLAEVLASDTGVLTPITLGTGYREGYDQQMVKRVWHCIARFGRYWAID